MILADNLSQFRIGDEESGSLPTVEDIDPVESIQEASAVYDEEEMTALESGEDEDRLSV